jgi:SAM-dependent methyltransferase
MHFQSHPAPWFVRHAALVVAGSRVLDVGCGTGRHARFFAERGAHVTAVDRDETALQALRATQNVTTVCRDIENDAWPFPTASFDAVIVCNYLWRATFAALLATIKPGGVLLYETFMDGHERYGKPSRPDFLLRSNELLTLTRDMFRINAYEEGEEFDAARQPFAVKQKIAAIKH